MLAPSASVSAGTLIAVDAPETRYARRPDGVSIAYQVVGDGPPDLLLSPGFISHLELQWTEPDYAHFLRRLSQFARLILYDKPGTGLSDPIPHVPSVEERVADIGHVLDAAGSREAALLGVSEGGPASIVFAATHPSRVRALVLLGTFATVQDESEVRRARSGRSRLRRWSSTGATTGRSPRTPGATSPRGSPVPGSWSSPARITCPGWATRTPWWTRSRRS